MTKISRRGFMTVTGAAAVSLPLVDQLLASESKAIHPAELARRPELHYLKIGACDMCGAQDPVFLQVEGGRVVATYGNAASAYSGGGKICGKAHAAIEKAYSPNRITQPMMRRGPGRYVPVSWDEAIEFMTGRLARIADRYGENAVQCFMGLGSQATIWKSFWKKTFGSSNVFGNDSVCDAGRRTAGGLTLGDTRPLPDLQHTRVGLVFGADYLASTKYLWYPTQMLSALEAGARFYVVDPRFSETAARAVAYGGKWLPIKPGTDAALASGIAHVIFADPSKYASRTNPDLVRRAGNRWTDGEYGNGVGQWADYCKDKTPEWAERVTGISAADIRQIADELMMSEAPLVDAWTGIVHRANGVYGCRAAFCLAGLVNAIDRKGGLVRQHGFKKASAGCRPVPGANYRQVGPTSKLASACGMYGFVRSDVNPFIPQAMLDPGFARKEYQRRRGMAPTDARDKPQDYPVKAFITATRNFANGNSDSALWRRALTAMLADPEALVVDINLFISEQGAHSHLVLPEASYFERDDLITPSSLYPTAHIRRAVVPPAGESKTMFEIARLLADGLAKHGFKGGRFSAADVIPYASYEQVIEQQVGTELWYQLKQNGVWQGDITPRYGRRGFGWSKLGKFTKSFDFSVPALAGMEPLADKLHPDMQAAGKAQQTMQGFELPPTGTFNALPIFESARYTTPTPEFPLALVTCGRNQWNSASKTVHTPSCVAKEPENLLTMNPVDAEQRALLDGDRVRVTAAGGGVVDIDLKVSQGIRPGCVHMANGYGQDNTTEPLARRRGTNVNELTDASNIDPIAGAEGLAEMLVRVEAIPS